VEVWKECGGLWRCGRSVVGCGGVEGVWWVVEVYGRSVVGCGGVEVVWWVVEVVTVIILTVVFVADNTGTVTNSTYILGKCSHMVPCNLASCMFCLYVCLT